MLGVVHVVAFFFLVGFQTGGFAGEKHEEESCSRAKLLMFFPESIVRQALIESGQTNQETAEKISKELAVKDRVFARIIDDKVSNQAENLLDEPNQRGKIIKLYQDTIYDTFATVLRAHGIENSHEIRDIFDEVRVRKSQFFMECLRTQSVPPSPQSPPSSAE